MESVSGKFKIRAGLRWSFQRNIQTSILNFADRSISGWIAATTTTQAISPKFSLIYQPMKTMSLYGGYANNFIVNMGQDIYGAPLKPSIVNQFELGLKNELFEGKVAANIGAYRIVNHNMAQMATVKSDGTVNCDTNVKELTGETTSDGFEVDFTGIWVNRLTF